MNHHTVANITLLFLENIFKVTTIIINPTFSLESDKI